jgi:peptide subunit release factor RF-3
MVKGLGGRFEAVRCAHCGDVIGVYEPIVVRTGEQVHESSRAAEPDVADHGAELYHRDCFAALKQPGGN